MKLIGIIGGMSWQSSAEYYRRLNVLAAEQLGGFHSARVLMHSVDFAAIEQHQRSNDWDAAGAQLAEAAAGLERAGADLVVLATNTMHKVAPAIERAISIPFLHLADATADAVRAADVHKVGLLGTAFTMEEGFYRERIESHGLEVVVPNDDDRTIVHRIIFDELVFGTITPDSQRAYLDVVQHLVDDGCDGVILGCTEIELLLPMHEACGVPLFPTTQIHVAAALSTALAETPGEQR